MNTNLLKDFITQLETPDGLNLNPFMTPDAAEGRSAVTPTDAGRRWRCGVSGRAG